MVQNNNVVYLNDSDTDLDESFADDMDEFNVESEIGSGEDDRKAEEARIAAEKIEKEKKKKRFQADR